MRILWILTLLLLFSCSGQEDNINSGINETEKDVSTLDGFNYFEYFENGSVKVAANQLNDVYHGEYQEFYKNGILKTKGKHNNGQRISIWRFYNDLEILEKVELYQDGKIINEFGPKNFDLETVNINQLQFDVPISWNTQVNPEENILLTTVENIENVEFSSNFSVTIIELSKTEYSFQDIVNLNLEAYKEQSNFFKIIDQGKPNFNFPSHQVIYIIETQDGQRLAGVTTFVRIGDYAFNMTGLARNENKGEFIEYKVLFQEMSGSLKKQSK